MLHFYYPRQSSCVNRIQIMTVVCHFQGVSDYGSLHTNSVPQVEPIHSSACPQGPPLIIKGIRTLPQQTPMNNQDPVHQGQEQYEYKYITRGAVLRSIDMRDPVQHRKSQAPTVSCLLHWRKPNMNPWPNVLIMLPPTLKKETERGIKPNKVIKQVLHKNAPTALCKRPKSRPFLPGTPKPGRASMHEHHL